MDELVKLTRQGDVLVVTIVNPPVNALSPGVPEGIDAAVAQANSDDEIKAVVLIGDGRTFVAGADIKELGKIASGAQKRDIGLREVLDRIEMGSVPVICAIHGTALGGGLELAQACHYRVAVESAQVGQPEVKLGIIPGAAGTQRLPRLIGMAMAAEMCASGRMVGAAEAASAGLIDRLIDGDLLEGAVAFARECIKAAGELPRSRDRDNKIADPDEWQDALAELRERVAKRSRGAVAAQRAIDAVEVAAVLPFDEGCDRETEIFNACLDSDECRALIHVFFAERAVNKIPDVPRDTATIDINRAAVVGAGTMGGGITMAYVDAGIPVTLKEADDAQLEKGLEKIRHNYEVSVQRGRITSGQMDDRLNLITPTTDYDRFMEADIVVEAVFEGLELKKQVFAELAEVTRPDAILASNTSTLDIDAIAEVTGRPEMVIGHHFFSPANVMRLLEIVRGDQTGKSVIATSMALAKRLRKVGVLVGNCRGFVGNRMFGPYMREAQFLLEEGASVQAVDQAHVNFGMAMGPLAVGDLAGLDVGWRIRKEYRHLEPEGMRQQTVADQLCEMGRFGQKTDSGWYRYEPGQRQGIPDPLVEELIEKCASDADITRRDIEDTEILERTLFALVNEAARILSDGYALRSSDIDIIYLNGYGFPAYRGGPMKYADTVGLGHVLERVREFEAEHGQSWEPAALLEQLVAEGRTFSDLDGG
jgi:3-hydroxyacyl-CoA dehydrogenase